MRIIYFILKFALNYSLRVIYPRVAFHNAPKKFFGRTIYVSNHPASFMDPILIASLQRPIVFFMTRADIFKPILKPLFWASHMFPIYRQLDNEDTKGKNEEVFDKCAKVLKNGRSLLIFGEGFTDDTFIRRLKPVKKGAIRIGFTTLEKIGWKKEIYIAAVGANYSDPHKMRSDILLSYSDRICLNDYREEYEQQPNKVIHELTKKIESLMQEQITHVETTHLAPFHDNIMILTRKGMHAESYDKKYTLKERWNYSRKLAKWLNSQDLTTNPALDSLKTDLETYMAKLKRKDINDNYIHWSVNSGNRSKEVLLMVLLLPFAIIGFLHCVIPYVLTKRFTEKSFKRKVFWASVKVILGMVTIAVFNVPALFLFYHFVYPSWWLATLYFLSIGLTGLAAYMWFVNLNRFLVKGKLLRSDLSSLIESRNKILAQINDLVPDNF